MIHNEQKWKELVTKIKNSKALDHLSKQEFEEFCQDKFINYYAEFEAIFKIDKSLGVEVFQIEIDEIIEAKLYYRCKEAVKFIQEEAYMNNYDKAFAFVITCLGMAKNERDWEVVKEILAIIANELQSPKIAKSELQWVKKICPKDDFNEYFKTK